MVLSWKSSADRARRSAEATSASAEASWAFTGAARQLVTVGCSSRPPAPPPPAGWPRPSRDFVVARAGLKLRQPRARRGEARPGLLDLQRQPRRILARQHRPGLDLVAHLHQYLADRVEHRKGQVRHAPLARCCRWLETVTNNVPRSTSAERCSGLPAARRPSATTPHAHRGHRDQPPGPRSALSALLTCVSFHG